MALVDAARRNAEAAEGRLVQTTQEHKELSVAVEDLKKRRDAAKEAYRYITDGPLFIAVTSDGWHRCSGVTWTSVGCDVEDATVQ